MRESADSDILSMTRVCKHWSKYIEHHPMWLTERIYKFLGRDYNTVEKAIGDVKILNPFGSRQIFSPKITYFLLLQRIKTINPNNGPKKRKLVSFPEDLKQFNNKGLYVPWLNQSVIQNPLVLWKFLWTAIRLPSWILRFKNVFEHASYRKEDRYNAPIIRKILTYLTVIFRNLFIF